MRIGTAALERWTARRELAAGGRGGGDGASAGAGYMLLAMAGFTFNDALAKGIGDSLSVAQLIAVRGTMLIVLIVACVVSALAQLLPSFHDPHHEPHFMVESLFGFYALVGFVSFVAAVFLGKALRLIVGRREDYYDG